VQPTKGKDTKERFIIALDPCITAVCQWHLAFSSAFLFLPSMFSMEHRKQSTHRCYAPARNGCQACASTLAAQELELESFKQAVQDAQKQVEELESDQTITTQLEQTGKNEICFAG